MQLTYSKSQFDVDEGQYIAKFLGITLLEPKPGEGPKIGRDGKPMPPGMAWRFEIQSPGPNKGKMADRVTTRAPTPKNICGRMLVAVSGQVLKDGMTVDINQYVGKFYRINVVKKEQSDGTCVSEMGMVQISDSEALNALAEQANGSQASSAPPSSGPPPRRNSAPPPAAATRYWVEVDGSDPVLMDLSEIEKRVSGGTMKLDDAVCAEGGSAWVPIRECIPGASSWIPF